MSLFGRLEGAEEKQSSIRKMSISMYASLY